MTSASARSAGRTVRRAAIYRERLLALYEVHGVCSLPTHREEVWSVAKILYVEHDRVVSF